MERGRVWRRLHAARRLRCAVRHLLQPLPWPEVWVRSEARIAYDACPHVAVVDEQPGGREAVDDRHDAPRAAARARHRAREQRLPAKLGAPAHAAAAAAVAHSVSAAPVAAAAGGRLGRRWRRRGRRRQLRKRTAAGPAASLCGAAVAGRRTARASIGACRPCCAARPRAGCGHACIRPRAWCVLACARARA
eukprot:364220-Chlamydomonas_euryale.AAC.3